MRGTGERWILRVGPIIVVALLWSTSGAAFQGPREELIAGIAKNYDKAIHPLRLPPTVVIVHPVLSDNGDHDGWADTNETVEMRLMLYNRMGQDLTGLVVRISTDDPKIACITQATIDVGNLADRETQLTSEAFKFLVADVHRSSVDEGFSVKFDIAMSSDQFAGLVAPPEDHPPQAGPEVIIDLDLDAAGGSGPSTFFEGFEGGFGAFTTMHLDENLNPPESDLGNHDAGLINSDGYRCRYDDPDFDLPRTRCYLGAHGLPDQFYFQLTADRAFSGAQSLHFGVFLDQSRGFTTPNAALQAVRTEYPVNLAWGSVCSETRTLSCVDDLGCPVGETCVSATPELSITHQISQLDHRIINSLHGGAQHAILQVQMIDGAGQTMGPWRKIEPHLNVYDTQNQWTFGNCSFDPIDDGNTEDDFYPGPPDQDTYFGPSSVCFPERTFVHQGNTEVFDPDAVGDASDGPGLEGAAGDGTWVRTAFDLSRYRGQRILLRLLESTLEITSTPTVESFFEFNPSPLDDGWFIDDVTITDTLTTPATVTVDLQENLDLKQDFDLDGVGAVCDCNSDDEMAWDLPGAAQNLLLDHAGGTTGTTTLSWSAPAFLGGTAVLYDTLRATNPADFVESGSCLEAGDGSDTQAQDTTHPAEGELHSFLVRAKHSCGAGPIGASSSGVDRPAIDCP